MRLLSTALLCMILCPMANAQVRIDMLPAPAASPAGKPPTIPWVRDGDNSWQTAPPLFRISAASGDPAAVGWAAVDDHAILLHVVVTDQQHVNNQTDGAIWDGDAIQLGVDAAGEGAPGMAAESQYTGPHDASITFALTRDGPKAWAHFHGRPGGVGALPHLNPSIVRDEKAKTTTYDLRLPWEEFQVRSGIYPRLGLAFLINDTDDSPGQVRINWGDGAGGCAPGMFRTLAIGSPPAEFTSIQVARQDLYRDGDAASFLIATNAQAALTAEVTVGQTQQSFDLPAANGSASIRRAAVRATFSTLPGAPVDARIRIADASGTQLAERTASLSDRGRPLRDLHNKLQQRATASASWPLLQRHYNSLDWLFTTEWTSAMNLLEVNAQPAAQCAGYAARLLKDLDQSDLTWDIYRDGRRQLVLAFTSPTDRTLQFYLLGLPRNWDPARAYPTIVYLHGSIDPHPLNFIAGTFGALPATQPATQSAPAYPDDPPAYFMMPWGRGNLGYQGIAEADVYEAIADARRTVSMDDSRCYLTGHSMGGGGTWTLGITAPDRWAAIAICSGGPWGAPAGVGLGRNLQNVPVYIFHGEADGAVRVADAYQMQKELQANGVHPVMRIVPGRGHGMEPDDSAAVNHWLVQHTRKRPASFSYVGYGPDHLQAYGIRMDFDPAVSFTPRFSCQIDGQNVRISSDGTPGLQVDLGRDGLGLDGPVTVFWNGKQVHQGPAERIHFEAERGQ